MGLIPTEGMFRSDPWHHVGVIKDRAFTFAEAKAEGFGFLQPVEKVRMSDLILGYTAQDDEYGAVRGDGLVVSTGLGEQWTPFQVEEGYAFGEAILGLTGGPGLVSLGDLRNGRQWFLTYDFGDFHIGDFQVRDYASVNGSFDSTWPVQLLSSPIVEVCENTIAAAIAMGTMHYRFKHTSGIFDRVEQAIIAVRRHNANREAMISCGERLLASPVGEAKYKAMLDSLFPVADDTPARTLAVNSAARETVNALYTSTADGVDVMGGTRGNGWGFMQAVNTYENWGAPVRKQQGQSKATTQALRQIGQIVTGKQPLTSRAIELVLA